MAIAKRYSVDVLQRYKMLLPILVLLYVLTMPLQHAVDPTLKKLHQNENLVGASNGLSSEFLILPLLGFREAAAGLLWVRADEFFHSGDYDAILPLVRLITWLDPHADNVYVTGAWHLSYNFTDSSERSDRRYIPAAMRLLDEGIANNMNLYEIKFEKGWELYDKVKDYVGAEQAYKLALSTKPQKDSDDYPYGAPLRVMHSLAHAYEKQGRIPEAVATWQAAMVRSNKMIAENFKGQNGSSQNSFAIKQLLEAEKHNYAINFMRFHDRYTATDHTEVNKSAYPAVFEPVAGGKPGPWDVAFESKVEVVRPKVFKISGRFNVADGARVDVRIADADYAPRDISTAINTFDVPSDQTVLIDSISVRKGKFEREMDMSKDPKMYSFQKNNFKIVLSFNPRSTSPHIQDRLGWSGEGLTDSNAAHVYIDKRPQLLGTKLIEGAGGEGPVWDGKDETWSQVGQAPRMVKVTYLISRDKIERGGAVLTDKDIVPND